MKKLFFGAMFIGLLLSGGPVSVYADADLKKEVIYTLYGCTPKWSADGSQVKKNVAKTRQNCSYNAAHARAVADYVLEVICIGECRHITMMTVDERKLYDELRATYEKTEKLDYKRCIYKTEDNTRIEVFPVYAHLFKPEEACEEKNIARVYDSVAHTACIKDVGCIPLYFVSRPGTEYDRLLKVGDTTVRIDQ